MRPAFTNALVTALMINLSLVCCAHAAPYTSKDAKDAATAAAAPIKSKTGTSAKLNSAYSQPITNNNALMESTDGVAKFNGALLCPSSTSFLEIFTGISTAGELSPMTITQDTNYDGILDTSYTVPYAVSGICANGIISCDPGTWSNCNYYLWEADAASLIKLTSTTLDQLGGCYCINNHCGTSLAFTNLSTELSDLGGGIAAALAQVNPLATITSTTSNGPTMTYYGTNMGACGQAGTADQSAYYKTPSAITTTAASTAAAAPMWSSTAYDASATYKLIKDSPAAQEAPTTLKYCSVNRQITLQPTMVPTPTCAQGSTIASANVPSGSWDTYGTDAWVEMRAVCDLDQPLKIMVLNSDGGDEDGCYASFGATPDQWLTLSAPTSGSFDFVHYTYPNYSRGSCGPITPIRVYGACVPGFSCVVNIEMWIGTRPSPWLSVDPHFSSMASCIADIGDPSQCAELGDGTAIYWDTWHTKKTLSFQQPVTKLIPDYSACYIDPEVISDGCAALSTDPLCRLYDETVDGVRTYKDYNPTMITPLASNATIVSNGCTMTYERDWWTKNRKYQCATSAAYNFDDVAARVDHIQQTATTAGYEDYQKDSSGTWNASAMTLTMPTMEAQPTCITACKTSRPKQSTEAGAAGVSQDMKNSIMSIEHLYHECEASVCPMGADETLVKDCACINTFSEAAGMMQIIRMGAKEMICTSGTPLPPPVVPMP